MFELFVTIVVEKLVGSLVQLIAFILKYTPYICTFLFCLLKLIGKMDFWPTKTINLWFGKLWINISESKWVAIPEILISWLSKAVSEILNKISVLLSGSVNTNIAILVTPLLFVFSMWVIFGTILGLITLFIYVIIVVVVIYNIVQIAKLYGKYKCDKVNEKLAHQLGKKFGEVLFRITTIGALLANPAGVLSFLTLLYVSLDYAFIISIVLIPLSPYMASVLAVFAMHITKIEKYMDDNQKKVFSYSFGFIIVCSINITLMSMIIGRILLPDHFIPKTGQMIISNLIFDVLTVYTTILILKRIIKNNSHLRNVFLIFIDIMVAAIYGILSVYFGLIFTQHSIGFRQCIFILVGLDINGQSISLGPLFWLLHTAFIPTAFYLSLILLGYLAKVFLSLVKGFSGRGYESKDPIGMTAYFFVTISAFFTILNLFL